MFVCGVLSVFLDVLIQSQVFVSICLSKFGFCVVFLPTPHFLNKKSPSAAQTTCSARPVGFSRASRVDGSGQVSLGRMSLIALNTTQRP